jgi:hypothetical protein
MALPKIVNCVNPHIVRNVVQMASAHNAQVMAFMCWIQENVLKLVDLYQGVLKELVKLRNALPVMMATGSWPR